MFLDKFNNYYAPRLISPAGSNPVRDRASTLRIVFEEFISVKGIKAQGNQLTPHKIKQVNTLESLEYIPEEGKSTDENDPILNEVKEDENDSGSAQTTLF